MMVRLYVFLAQYLDRCLDEAAHHPITEQEFRDHLSATRSAMSDMLAVNPVVQRNVEQECERILSLGATCIQGRKGDEAALSDVKQARAVLQNKMVAISDLLAVFRAM